MGLVPYRDVREDLSFHHVRIQEDSHLQTRKRALTGHWICQHLGLLNLWNCEKQIFVFISPHVTVLL